MEQIVNKKYAVIAISSFAVYHIIGWIAERIRARKANRRGKEKLRLKLLKNRNFLNLTLEKKNEILKLKAFEISESIRNGQFSIREILDVYMERAQLLGRKHNLTAEEMFEDALSRLDSIVDSSDSLLFGVPISIKDHIYQEGCCSSGGVVRHCFTQDLGDSPLVSMLRNSGSIPFVRGNVIQMLMWIETTNNIYGTAENPWDITRTTGGSSGGDAGLVAIGGTPLSIGSDIGGSIRIPAAFCGICGFKPSSRRISGKYLTDMLPKHAFYLEFVIKGSIGPMARCVEDMVLVLKSWWKEELWQKDNNVIPLKFNNKEYESNKKLRIGYFTDNKIMKCADVVSNVVLSTVDKLSNDGHTLIEMSTDLMYEAFVLCFKALFCMEGSCILDILDGEDPSWPFLGGYLDAKYPGIGSILLLFVRLSGFKQNYNLLSQCQALTFKEFTVLAAEITNIKTKFHEYYQSQHFDAVICPIWPLVAPQHGSTQKMLSAISYSCVWNVFDFPAGVIPVKLVEPGEDIYNSNVQDAYVKAAKDVMKGSVGLPISIQVVGNSYEDEKVLRVMKIIQGYYNFFENYHCNKLVN